VITATPTQPLDNEEITDEMIDILAWRLIAHYGGPDEAIKALS